jgi:hypothetical protein
MELATNDKNLQLVAWPNRPPTLHSRTVSVNADKRIDSLLENEGIRPDSEAFNLLYDLNPTVERLDQLTNGTRLVVPYLSENERPSDRYVILLTVDKRLKDKLNADVGALGTLSTAFSALSPNQFADPKNQASTKAAVKELVHWFSTMNEIIRRRTAKPMRRMTLQQISDEASVLRLILESSVKRGEKLSASNEELIFRIHEDIQDAIGRWDEPMGPGVSPADPQYEVEVDIRGDDPHLIETLRVYYIVWGLFQKPLNARGSYSSFNGLGAKSSAVLAIKKYKVWAARDGDPTNPVTTEADLEVAPPPTGSTIPPLVLTLRANGRT